MSRSAAIIGTVVGIALGSFGAAQIGLASHRVEQKASDDCWIKGGEYKDGRCEMPEDLMSNQEKVCIAMRGEYWTQKKQHAPGVDFTCYRDGKVLEIPDMTGMEVVLTEDGAVAYDRRG